jgi:AraC-like DNA-binding protein
LSQAKSDYSHYEIRSGVKYISVLDRLSTFTYAIMGAGIASALLGIVWIVFVSRRNYKPVERIVNRLDKIKKHSSGKVRDRQDEFQVIELAIERMAEDSERFERRHEEDLLYKRQILFLELLEGKRQIIAAPYLDASEFGIGADTGPLQVVVAEIDGYAAFADQYGRSDQNLLKYAMEKTANELAELYGLPVMSEWTAHNRFSLLLQLQPPPAVNHPLFGMGTELLKWIGSHLPFTITLSIGCCVDGIQNVSQSYNSAITQLEYKPSLGNNRIIQEKEVVGRPHTDMYRIVQLVRPFTQAYKLGESDWPEKLETFFDELGQGIFTRDDLESLMNYAMYHFHREMTELASESKSLWEQAAMPKMILLLERTETLEELRSEWTILLKDVWQRMHLMREQRNHSLLLKRMKAYIHEHYADPDVSLTSLSDVFGLSPKYLSRLFKEEFGETFVEYILNVRIEQAKRKLTESADSVQEISMQVGYTTSIAFIRVFKKTVGVTPGDYRKEAKAYGFENDL